MSDMYRGLPQVYDVRNDEELRLSDDEVRFLRRLQKNKYEQVDRASDMQRAA